MVYEQITFLLNIDFSIFFDLRIDLLIKKRGKTWKTLGGGWGRVGASSAFFFSTSPLKKKAKNVIRRKKINVDFFVEFWVTSFF